MVRFLTHRDDVVIIIYISKVPVLSWSEFLMQFERLKAAFVRRVLRNVFRLTSFLNVLQKQCSSDIHRSRSSNQNRETFAGSLHHLIRMSEARIYRIAIEWEIRDRWTPANFRAEVNLGRWRIGISDSPCMRIRHRCRMFSGLSLSSILTWLVEFSWSSQNYVGDV